MYKGDDYLRDLVRARASDGQNEWARQNGVDPSALSLFMTGARGAGPALIKALGLVKVVAYEKATCNRESDGIQ